ncbi:hypothetical protein J3R83DRAFT_13962 [Lanmaoa asiatica]|nr:hypothetical protein J3R83DRAFT_13962 [Lanmaoa asiatica]
MWQQSEQQLRKLKQERVITIAKMVMELQAKEQDTTIPEVPGQASGTKRMSASPNTSSTSTDSAKGGNKHQMLSNVPEVVATSVKPGKRAPKALLKAMINEASKTITNSPNWQCSHLTWIRQWIKLVTISKVGTHIIAINVSTMLLLTESTLSFVNLLITNYESDRKQTLSSTVKGWATLVHEKALPKSSLNTGTKGSTFSVPSSQATKVNTLATTSSTQHSDIDAGITTKFGGFNLNSEGNNDKEHETEPLKNKEEKSNDNIALVVPSTPDDSDSEVEEASQIPPWYSPHGPPAHKRKMDEIVLDSESEGDEMAESNMQIDTDMTQEIRTTTSVDITPDVNFILKLIATTHLSKTVGAINIQSLETVKLQKGYGMECVIALAAAAVIFLVPLNLFY